MTQIQRERILELQDAGLGYKKIAAELGISVNTVKSFCRRQRLKMYDAFCLQCGSPIQQPPRVRKKKFCSDKCRSKWWNRHPEQLQRQTMQHLTCVWCGRAFERYGKPKQQYEKAKTQLEQLRATKTAREAQAKAIGSFMFEVQELDAFTEFDEKLWLAVIDKVTVHTNGRMTFHFRSGTEIDA